MWESLATTARQDRALHGAAKLANLLIGLIATPLWLLGQWLSGPLRRLLGRRATTFEPLPVPPARERSMDALMADLEAIPHRLHPQYTAELRKGLADWANFVLSQHRHSIGIAYSYPAQFRLERFAGADGVPIAATVALHDQPRPGLVVVHGLFSNRLFDYVRRIAVRAYYEWGFDVAAIDLRSFGHTDLLSDAPSTGGWKEGEDVLAAGRWLKSLGATSVGALGISLGASSVLGAAHLDGAEEGLDGGILAVCGPADTRAAAARLSRPLPFTHPAWAINRFFATMLRARVRAGRWPEDIADLLAPIERVSAPYYGVPAQEVWERSSARNSVAGARVPLLALHSEDDLIVPVEHARMLAEAAEGNPNVRVWIVPGGQHAAFDAIDAEWTEAVYRGFFERWADYGDREAAELVYSPARAGSRAAATRS